MVTVSFMDRVFGVSPSTPAPAAAANSTLTAAAVAPHQVGWQSPMSPSNLQAVVWADLTGQEAVLVTRDSAMGIPALARQRHLLVGVAARCPLRLVDTTGPADQPPPPVAEQPDWLTTGHASVSAYHRMLWTVDDLVFHPFSVWAVERQGGPAGPIVWADRVSPDRWEVEAETDRLLVDDSPIPDDQVLIIPGPHEGILAFGAGSIGRALDNLEAAAKAARNPAAYLEIHYDGDEPLTAAAKAELIEAWARARRGEFGGVAYTGKHTTVIEHGTHEAHLLIGGREADAVDMSRLVSSPSAMADATSAGASLTYETTTGRNVQFLDYGASLYMDSIAARLSMDDVCAPGLGIAFDVTRLTVVDPDLAAAPAAVQE